jgi:hypothetical protein
LSPVSAVVQLRPQLHYVDASEELAAKGRSARAKKDVDDDVAPRVPETEARVIDVKLKPVESDDDLDQGNNQLLQRIHTEPWEHFEWIDAEVGLAP